MNSARCNLLDCVACIAEELIRAPFEGLRHHLHVSARAAYTRCPGRKLARITRRLGVRRTLIDDNSGRTAFAARFCGSFDELESVGVFFARVSLSVASGMGDAVGVFIDDLSDSARRAVLSAFHGPLAHGMTIEIFYM
jgi:hypothetical protein